MFPDTTTEYPLERVSALIRKTGAIDGMWSKEQISTHALTLAIALRAVSAERDSALNRIKTVEELLKAGVAAGEVLSGVADVTALLDTGKGH